MVRLVLLADDCGQALLEFALTIPIVLVVLFGIFDFGRAMYTYDMVTSAARVGARYAIVHGSSCTPAPACTATSAVIQTYVRSVVAGANSNSFNVSATWPAATGCSGGTATPQCPVSVSASYPFAFLLWSSLTIRMTSTSQMVISR
jgi:Flp pilus assembly protein TadG